MPAARSAGARTALFLHGAGAWGGQWVIWQRVFAAAGWTTFAPDLQPAPAGLAATGLDDYVAQAHRALAALPPGAVLVGASLGGLLAAVISRHAEPAVRRPMVLVNPVPASPFSRELSSLRPADDATVVPWRSAARFESTRRAMPRATFEDQQLAFRHWRDESARVLREAWAGVALDAPLGPALVIASEDDRDIPVDVSARYAASLGASLLRVPGTHLDPVMGRGAAAAATAALAWCEAQLSSG